MFLTFPCPIHTIHLNIPNIDELVQYAHQESKISEGVKKSNAGGWQSFDDYHGVDNPISKVIHSYLQEYFNNREIFSKNSSMKMTSMWFNINNPGDYNHSHNHPGCDLSGVLWLKVPKDSGNIVFESPNSFTQSRLLGAYSQKFKDELTLHDWFYMQPQVGLLILFPSHLNHSVTKNNSDEDRISVAFNVSVYHE